MQGQSLFRHEVLAPLTAILERSPTARAVMASVEHLPTGVRIEPCPANGSTPAQVEHATQWAYYSALRNDILIPASFLTRDAHVVQVADHGRTIAQRIPGGLDAESAALVVHEAAHRAQAGRFPRLRTSARTGTGYEAARALLQGVRAIGSRSVPGRNVSERFLDGFDASTMRFEIDAYQVQGRVLRELGVTAANAAADTTPRLLAYLRSTGDYPTRMRTNRMLAAGGGVAAVAGAVTGVHRLASAEQAEHRGADRFH